MAANTTEPPRHEALPGGSSHIYIDSILRNRVQPQACSRHKSRRSENAALGFPLLQRAQKYSRVSSSMVSVLAPSGDQRSSSASCRSSNRRSTSAAKANLSTGA
ncbi:hypothetical protein EYF80_019568 [Liparis tanakae]|uniref:Uncharacterized protein n=1 Tax=Liparis tanakae TaxID=230148 RepID=A0A4Z2HWX1_9TELE|nr:hypothetical protein EYF80_019568 [Liparis tanakae]